MCANTIILVPLLLTYMVIAAFDYTTCLTSHLSCASNLLSFHALRILWVHLLNSIPVSLYNNIPFQL